MEEGLIAQPEQSKRYWRKLRGDNVRLREPFGSPPSYESLIGDKDEIKRKEEDDEKLVESDDKNKKIETTIPTNSPCEPPLLTYQLDNAHAQSSSREDLEFEREAQMDETV